MYKIFSFLYKLTFYFLSPTDIELNEEDHRNYDLTGNRLTYMRDLTKYFVWRKYSLYLLIPFLLTNIILNITNYFNVKKNIEYYQTYNSTEYLQENPIGFYEFDNIKNKTQHFIELLNSGKTLDYILFYNIFSSVCISIELLLIYIAIYKSNIWYSSKNWIKYCAWFSYFWIYCIYVNPVIHYFKLESQYDDNKTITNQNYLYSYSFTYVLYNLLKEIIPLGLCFFGSMLWSVSNIKCIFPQSIYIGWLYNYVNVIFFLTTGTLLLIINQLMSNSLLSIGICIFILGLYFTNWKYGRKLKYYYQDSVEVVNYHFKINFVKNITFSGYLILCLVFILIYDNPLTQGIYKFYKTDIAYFITKMIYKTIFYKVLCSDILIKWLLDVEKYRDAYKVEMRDYCDKLKYIERQLYEDRYYNAL